MHQLDEGVREQEHGGAPLRGLHRGQEDWRGGWGHGGRQHVWSGSPGYGGDRTVRTTADHLVLWRLAGIFHRSFLVIIISYPGLFGQQQNTTSLFGTSGFGANTTTSATTNFGGFGGGGGTFSGAGNVSRPHVSFLISIISSIQAGSDRTSPQLSVSLRSRRLRPSGPPRGASGPTLVSRLPGVSSGPVSPRPLVPPLDKIR